MRIKSVACDQFAGILDKELEFDKGLNIILGDNETGKSTMVELIYHMLFQDSKLDARKDTAFIENYFPKKVSGPVGDVIDGELKFQTEEGSYKLTKEWDKKEGSCKLRTPDGTVIRSEEQIKEVLRGILGYGQGVYGEIVFPTQKRSQDAIASIMKELSKKKSDKLDDLKGELASVLNQAALETGGIFIDKLENEIKGLLNMYGERWDFELDLPEGGAKRGLSNPWKSVAYTKAADEGKQAVILRSYYDLKSIEKSQADTLIAEKNVEQCKDKLIKVQNEKKTAQDNKDKLLSCISELGQIAYIKEKIINLETKKKEQDEAIIDWPIHINKAKLAGDLAIELANAQMKDLYEKALKVKKELDDKTMQLRAVKPISQEEINDVRKLRDKKAKLEGQLCSLDLVARINNIGDVPINVISANAGEPLQIIDNELIINEVVEINVPDIMEILLMPKDVDVHDIKEQIDYIDKTIAEIFDRYNVINFDELENIIVEYKELVNKLDILNQSLKFTLGNITWDELTQAVSNIPEDIATVEVVNARIEEELGSVAVNELKKYHQDKILEYENKYGTYKELESLVMNTREELFKLQDKLDSFKGIPEEYAEINDPGEYSEYLNLEFKRLEKECDELNQELKNAEIILADRISEEYEEALIQTRAKFENAKETYQHWCNIFDVFLRLKEYNQGNATIGIEDKFKEYLNVISEGKLSLIDLDDKLNIKLASDNHAMTYDILSEGTKDTVSLAFRLAMLEHIFPEGGGLAIFDDPFTDMDPQRVAESCKLIEKFAQNNQVLFVTCDEKYQNIMLGKIIKI